MTARRLLRRTIRYSCAAVLLIGPHVSKAATPLTARERGDLVQALDKLTAARQAMAMMVTDCNRGTILVDACRPPPPGGGRLSECADAVASCDLVLALRNTDVAIDALQKALRP